MESVSYLSWFVMACKVFGIAVVVVISMAVLFYKEKVISLFNHFR